MDDIDLEEIENNSQQTKKVKQFLRDGCGCVLGARGGQCFSEEDVLFNLNNCH